MEYLSKEVVVKFKIDSKIANWLEDQKASRDKGNVTSKAVEFYYNYLFYKKGFLIRLIQENFELIKHMVRQIGSTR